MPARRGFCWCLGGSAPPEISYDRAVNGGMALKPIQLDLPMPEDEAELNAKFSELVDELGLDKVHREAMFNLPPEKKWQIYCSQTKDQQKPTSANYPDYYINNVKEMTNARFIRDPNEIEVRTKMMESLKTALRTQPMSFVLRYIELNGLDCLLNLLKSMDTETSRSSVHTSALGCLKALMNSSDGRGHVLAHPTGVDIIAQSLIADNARTKVAALEILGAMCLVPGGHKKVLQAMVHYQNYSGERTRFQSLMNFLDCMAGEYKDDIVLKTAIMGFINAALKYGAGQTHLEFRLHLRYEFLMLGLQPIIEKLRSYGDTTLDRHLDFFEMIRIEDERQLAKKFEVNHVDTKSATSMFDLLRKKLSSSIAYGHMRSVLFHLLQLPFGNNQICLQYWQLIDKIIQQVALQTKDGNPDNAPLDIDIKKLVKQLANESTMKEFHHKIRELQKENDELLSKIAKKERECEVKLEEKEELMQTLNNIKARLDKETTAHADTRSQLDEMAAKLFQLQQLIDVERSERFKLEHAVNSGSLPDDAKVGLSSSSLSGMGSFNKNSSGSYKVPPPPMPPPPPSGSSVPPPPPPPFGVPMAPSLSGKGSSLNFNGHTAKKNVPQSTQPLKSFNWAKLPDNIAKNTIWKDIDETRLYRTLDLEEFERQFSAYQRQESEEILGGGGRGGSLASAAKVRELSVIDGRRAQNCTILLSKLKMTNQELSRAILSVDGQEEIPKDMCEQLMKFVPTVEEIQMLTEHEHEIDQMAKADRFLFEMSRIDHYELRLKALYYKKKFHERMSDAKQRIESVLEACKQLAKSRHLRKLLEVVLAFGNYMNRGQRGNAYGFRISSLNKIIDTKSSVNRRVTLMNYLAEIVDLKFPELLKLEDDIHKVREASKVNLTELEVDVNVLRTGLREIEKELDYHRNRASSGVAKQQDKFSSVMGNFVSVGAFNFSELEEQHKDMKSKFEKVVELFGEEPQKIQPDEFFTIFEMFLASFAEAKLENERLRRQREEEEKRQTIEAQIKIEREAKDRIRRESKDNGQAKGEFDDLISALRTGEVFGEDMAKLKQRNGRRRLSQQKSTTEIVRERVGPTKA